MCEKNLSNTGTKQRHILSGTPAFAGHQVKKLSNLGAVLHTETFSTPLVGGRLTVKLKEICLPKRIHV